LYVAAPRTSIDRAAENGAAIPIEARSPDELLLVEGMTAEGVPTRVRVAPPGTVAINPAFDVTPAEFIAGILTEVGLFPASPAGIAAALEANPG
jgi:methylthioribose-1-phosphate isomerase